MILHNINFCGPIKLVIFSIIITIAKFNINSIRFKWNLRIDFRYDFISISIIILTIYLILIIFISQLNLNYKNNLYFILVTLSLFLILTFRVNTFILFYFYFELRLIPIFLIIIGWGYQPERLKAGLLIFFLYFSCFSTLVINNFIHTNYK